MEISVMVEGQQGLTWSRWKAFVAEVDASGFAGLYRSDHFTHPRPPDQDSLELLVSLAYAADHTEHVQFGPLVSPVSFRDPVMLTRQAMALDDLSGGRFVLGVGAGWQEREHDLFGYHLGDMRTRMARLQEALEVITRLLRQGEPVEFEGEHYRLRGATLLPRPARPGGPPILIGGSGPRRTLPLVARYADIWNSLRLSPEEFRERSALLDDLAKEAGREPGEIRRTIFTGVYYADGAADLEEVLARLRDQFPEMAGRPTGEVLDTLRSRHTIIGTGEMIMEQLAAFEAVGVEEIVLRWSDLDDMERLRAFASGVLQPAA